MLFVCIIEFLSQCMHSSNLQHYVQQGGEYMLHFVTTVYYRRENANTEHSFGTSKVTSICLE